MFDKDDLIFSYTRKQALADGQLVDITTYSSKIGFRYSFAMNQETFYECFIEFDDDGKEVIIESELITFLNVVLFKIVTGQVMDNSPDRMSVDFYSSKNKQTHTIWVGTHGDDDGNPCWTASFPLYW